MKTNCRNCVWAEWSRNAAGRREFGNFAECSFPVQIPVIPKSRPGLLTEIKRKVSVLEYTNKDLVCLAWQRLTK